MKKFIPIILILFFASCGVQVRDAQLSEALPNPTSQSSDSNLTFSIEGSPQNFDLKTLFGESEDVIEINGEKIVLMKSKEIIFSQGSIVIENNQLTIKPMVGTEGLISIDYVAGDKKGKINFLVKSKNALCDCSGVIKKRIASFGLLTQYADNPSFGIASLGIINIGLDSHYTNKNFKIEWGDGTIENVTDSVPAFSGVTWYRDDYHLLSIPAPHIYPGAGDYVLKVSALSDEGLYSEASTIVRINSSGGEEGVSASNHAPFFPFPASKHPTDIDVSSCDQPELNGYSVGLVNQHSLKINNQAFIDGIDNNPGSGDVYRFSNIAMPPYLGIQSLRLRTSFESHALESQSDYLLYCE